MNLYLIINNSKCLCLIVIILLSVVVQLTIGYHERIVNTNYGKLKGYSSISRDGHEYYNFLGIPYATPPVGPLRFASPIKPNKWTGIRIATRFGSLCTQVFLIDNIQYGTEDCLYLNVFTKNIPRLFGNSVHKKKYIKLLPVIIYIHGGLYIIGGSNEAQPDYIMDEDIVFVTINYRLASFGFLNTGDGTIRGNMALKDQVLSFKWVQENIKYFGGDPKLVTIAGGSSGGASVHYHMMSAMSKGLFHRAISMSGTSLNPWAFNKEPKQQAERFGKSLNCPTNSSILLLECLRHLSSTEISNAHKENQFLPQTRLAAFSPSVESVDDADAFLTKHPRDLIKTKLINNVPWMAAVNNAEGLIVVLGSQSNKTIQTELSEQWLRRAPVIFDYENLSEEKKNAVSNEIRKQYFGNNRVNFENIDKAVKIFSDSFFFEGFHAAVTANSNSSNTYVYINTYETRRSQAKIIYNLSLKIPFWFDGFIAVITRWFRTEIFNIPEYYGAGHIEDADLLFRSLVTTILPGSPDYNVSKHLTKTIAYFAKHGKPPSDLTWPTVKSGQPLQFLKISNKFEIIDDPLLNRILFWRKLKNKYNF